MRLVSGTQIRNGMHLEILRVLCVCILYVSVSELNNVLVYQHQLQDEA